VLKNVIMPTLGLDMVEATIEKWLKRPGESVAKDEPLVVVETDKASTEIVAPTAGILKQILQVEGSVVPVTHTIAVIETAETEDGASERPVPSVSPKGVRASPAARRVAKDLGVDLAAVEGTGPAGRVQGYDVRHFANSSEGAAARENAASTDVALPAPRGEGGSPSTLSPVGVQPRRSGLPGTVVPLGKKRRLTADRMALSARSVARLTLNMEIDAGQMMDLRSRLLPEYQSKGVRLSYDAILAKVVANALVEHPYLNARWTDKGVLLIEPINVGVAVAVDDGLVVPVIRDANRKDLMEVASDLSRLVAKAREDRLALDDISDGTFTITNLGAFDVDSFTPIVNPPEAAILGVGRVVEKPVGVAGNVVLRPRFNLSLSFDHRIVDGAPAARFLQLVKKLLEEPYLLI
jgi:pyruvate dehydrogenase E2 component (dihydrolipoamide acetyltransferase)